MAGERIAALEELRKFVLSEAEDPQSGKTNTYLEMLQGRIEVTEADFLNQHVQDVSEATNEIRALLVTEHGTSMLWDYVRDWSLNDICLVLKELVASAKERALVH